MKESIVILILTYLFSLNAKAALSTYECKVIRRMDQVTFLKVPVAKGQIVWKSIWNTGVANETVTVGIENQENYLNIQMNHVTTGRQILVQKVLFNNGGDERNNPELITVESTNQDYTQWTVQCQRGIEE